MNNEFLRLALYGRAFAQRGDVTAAVAEFPFVQLFAPTGGRTIILHAIEFRVLVAQTIDLMIDATQRGAPGTAGANLLGGGAAGTGVVGTLSAASVAAGRWGFLVPAATTTVFRDLHAVLPVGQGLSLQGTTANSEMLCTFFWTENIGT